MNLNLTYRTQHPPNSNSSAVALRAATLSVDKGVTILTASTEDLSNCRATQKGCMINEISTTSSRIERAGTGDKGHLNLQSIQQSKLKDKMQEHNDGPSGTVSKSPLLQKSSSMVAATVAAAKFRTPMVKGGVKVEKRGDKDKPATGAVNTCCQLCWDSASLREYSPAPSVDISPGRNKLQNISSQGVDSSSLEDISSLKNLFEKSTSKQPTTIEAVPFPTICAPKPVRPVSENPSLTAAILATQLSPSNSTHGSSRSSPIPKQGSKSAQGTPTAHLAFGNRSSSHTTAHEPSPFLLALPKGLSDQRNALLAATLAVKPPRSKSQPPKPPPPRRGQDNLKAPNGKTSEIEDISDALPNGSVETGDSKHDTTHSSMSLKPSLSHPSTLPIPSIPKRRLSLGNISHRVVGDISSAAVSAAASTSTPTPADTSPVRGSYRQTLPLSHYLTGDSVLAASLVSSRVNSPAPRKPPAPPAPRRGRRKSLPPPPKTGLRETMRKPESPPAEASPQGKMPNLIKHHAHRHAEGESRRWRHFITDVERKRFEGLWAANKGLLLITCDSNSKGPPLYPFSLQRAKSHGKHNIKLQQHVWSSTPNYTEDLSDCIDSLIARDIWTRSRLPFHHLADIWDLVDRGMKGRLSRDEFIVGTWLIDQSLKGRKLPFDVQDEVWQSVRGLGVKIPQPGCRSTTYSDRH